MTDGRDDGARGPRRRWRPPAALHRIARLLVRPFGRRDNAVAGWLFDLGGGVYRTAGMSFEVPREMTTLRFRGRFFLGAWERPEVALVERWIEPGARVLEVGGCLGVVSGHVQGRLARPDRHVVVEAHPGLIPVLRRNRDRNGHCYAIEHGLLDNAPSGRLHLHLHPLIVGASTLAPTDRPVERTVEVPVLSFARLEHRHGLRFNTLVLDCEGGELALLEAIAPHLDTIDRVVVETHAFLIGDCGVARCREILAGAGLERLEVLGNVEAWGRR